MPAAIEIKNLSKWYGKFCALKKINLRIEKGEFFGYLGPNGAGKTTTISCIVGLSDFQRGSVRVFGKDVVSRHLETKPLIGIAPQEFKFDPFFSIEQLLKYLAGYYGLPGREAEERAKKMLKLFELDGKASASIHRLSGGMKRRLQLAKAMVHDPPILILDEPTAGVDVDLRHRLWDYLTKLKKEGKTIVLTTHYIEEAERLCDRIGIIDHGEIRALDKKENLISQRTEHVLKIDLYTEIKSVPPEMRKLDCSVQLAGKTITVRCKNSNQVLPKIINILSKKGAEIDSIDIAKGKLEDIYLKITGKSGGFE